MKIDILGRVRNGGYGGEGEAWRRRTRWRRRKTELGVVDRDVGSRVPRKGAMVHPRDRREINSSGLSRVPCVRACVLYICIMRVVCVPITWYTRRWESAYAGAAKRRKRNGNGERERMVDDVDSRDRCSRLPRKMTYRTARSRVASTRTCEHNGNASTKRRKNPEKFAYDWY